MPDDISDDVVGVLRERIEARFAMDVGQLQAAVAAAPTAHPDATEAVHWYDRLLEAQSTLEQAEDELLAALDTQHSTVDDPTIGLAHRVNEAVTVRDGRALLVRWLLDPGTADTHAPAAERLAHLRPRTGPAVQTRAPQRPAAIPIPPSARPAGRGTR